ncbi:hypothetical protein BJF85_15540 [Saccharomonospora sp. CUA-673]|uniref:MFS transporter n=1 Tax=Saccharomonospora sp. CUA-673 TaxID=1904969 RepID=UPI00095CE57A|nr:MFS transporter [Saccharomonospora sp. CUA-673]OLT47578.1 hypothetical protein BJF85_15540 [Saccharomonospora sp. CUA-673]
MTTVDSPPPRATPRQWLGLAVLVVPLFMLSTDITVLFLALPAITADLVPVGSQQLWILHIGEFLSAATMITFGLVARRIGARKLLLGAVTVYGSASLVAAYATSAEMLIGGRALLGVATAAITPAGMILVRRTFRDPQQYNVAFATYLAAFAGGAAAGPVLGGFMLEHFWWGAVFLINVPIAAVLVLGGPLLLERNHGDPTARIDPASVVLSTTAMGALVFGLQETAAAGVSTLPALSTAVGAGLLALFLRRQRRTDSPLLDLTLFRSRQFSFILAVLFVTGFAMAVADMLVPQYLQVIRGLSPWETGLTLLAPAIAATVGTMLTPVLIRVLTPARAVASVLAATGVFASLVAILVPGAGLVGLVVVLSMTSLTVAPVMTLLSQLIIGAAPEEKTGSATAVQDVIGSLGMASSLAFLGSGVLGIYRHIVADRAGDDVPAGALDAASESFGASVGVVAELSAWQAARLTRAVEEAFTVATQTGWGVFGLLTAGLAAVVVALRRLLR